MLICAFHSFDIERTIVLAFIVDVSEYDRTVEVDGRSVNKLVAALEQFEEIVNLFTFKEAHVLVILNGVDTFKVEMRAIRFDQSLPF